VALGIGIGFASATRHRGFILVPALIYLLRVPTNLVIGTADPDRGDHVDRHDLRLHHFGHTCSPSSSWLA
jgi:hypothetical protein